MGMVKRHVGGKAFEIMIKINQMKLPISHTEQELKKKIIHILKLKTIYKNIKVPEFSYQIVKQSLDARKKPSLFYVYAVSVSFEQKEEDRILKLNRDHYVTRMQECAYVTPSKGSRFLTKNPVVIGSGPAGLFCAYLLALEGYCPIVLERGENVDKRVDSVDKFWAGNPVNPESNVQFGEGGAGTFSDGKLNTLVKDPNGRNQYVLDTFVKHGAKKECAFMAKPHLGTDELTKIIKSIRTDIIDHGGQFLFSCKLTNLVEKEKAIKSAIVDNFSGEDYILSDGRVIGQGISVLDTDIMILAIGHSARDTFEMLDHIAVPMRQKQFAVGLRIEHPQKQINQNQYGQEYVEGLSAADYKVTNQAENSRSVYSFCMCPGGYVVNASSEEGRLAVNGMSYSGRDSANANSALIVSVGELDFGANDALAGMRFQRQLEEKAYALGDGKIPIQRYGDFKENRVSTEFGKMMPCAKGKTKFANLRTLFCEEINEALIESIEKFGYTMKGFSNEDTLLSGIESRTSSPVRILRNEDGESEIKGLYPCGEGAGYAGGITSAAMDGMKIAEKIIKNYCPAYSGQKLPD